MAFRSIFVFQLPSLQEKEIAAVRAGFFDMLRGIPGHQFVPRPPHKLLLLVEWLDEREYRDLIGSWRLQEYYEESRAKGRPFALWREEQLDSENRA